MKEGILPVLVEDHPRNERDVLRVWNAFSEAGVQVIDDQAGNTTSRATPTGRTWNMCTGWFCPTC